MQQARLQGEAEERVAAKERENATMRRLLAEARESVSLHERMLPLQHEEVLEARSAIYPPTCVDVPSRTAFHALTL